MNFFFDSGGQYDFLEFPDELAPMDGTAILKDDNSAFDTPMAAGLFDVTGASYNIHTELDFVHSAKIYKFAASSDNGQLSSHNSHNDAELSMDHGTTLIFRSSQEASHFRKMSRRHAQLGDIPPAYVMNKPAAVRLFYDAMVSLDGVCDESLETKNFRRGKYTRIEIEAACWRLADILYELYEIGPQETEPLHSEHEAQPPRARPCETLNFEDRLNLMCQMLRKRKTACSEALFAEEKLYGMIAAPTAHMKRKATNARSNANKADRISAHAELMAMMKESNDEIDLLRLLRKLKYGNARAHIGSARTTVRPTST